MVRVQLLSFLLILLPFCSLQSSFSPPHLLLFLHLLFFLTAFPPSGQAKLITTTKMIIVPGQIGMRPPLHCSSTFSTCKWFTNSTKIPGGPHSIKDSLNSSTCTDDILLFTMLSQISFPRWSNSWPWTLDLRQAVLLRSRWHIEIKSFQSSVSRVAKSSPEGLWQRPLAGNRNWQLWGGIGKDGHLQPPPVEVCSLIR